ncbi:MAG: response regulator [Nitrospirae bacterium]|nr:response regulator [Nitrospirota bacterium]
MKKILIADDESSLRFLLRMTLEGNGFDILEAADGKQALALAQKQIPDLIILDVVMPDLYGSEVCERLRKQTKTARIPVIIITANSNLYNEEQAKESGADYYMTKPFSPLKLRNLVHQILADDKPSDS